MKKNMNFFLRMILTVVMVIGLLILYLEFYRKNDTSKDKEANSQWDEIEEQDTKWNEIVDDVVNTEEVTELEGKGEQNLEELALLNKINRNKIKDQSFHISLNDWGEVEFVSTMPDYEEDVDPFTDVSFYLLRENKIVYEFPFVAENNVRTGGVCEGVSFVYFDDISGDGREDVIIGALYVTGAGPQGMIPYTEIRIFEDLGRKFTYNKSLSDELNGDLPGDVTAGDIKERLKEKK